MSQSEEYEEGEEDKIIKQLQQVRSIKPYKKKKFKLPRQIAKLKAEADNLYIFGKRHEAKQILEDIIKKYPDYEDAYRLYGLICLDEQDGRKAANFMIMASKQKSGVANQKNWISIAHLLREEENYEFAALYFGKALKSDPNNIEIMQLRYQIKQIKQNNYRVECFEKIGEFRKAIKELLKMRNLANAFQLNSLCNQISGKLAFFYLKIQQYEKAKEELNSVEPDQQAISLTLQISQVQKKYNELIPQMYELYRMVTYDTLFNHIIENQHIGIIKFFFLGLYYTDLDEVFSKHNIIKYSKYIKKFLNISVQSADLTQLFDFFNYVEQNDLSLSTSIIKEFYGTINNKSQFNELEQFLNKRYHSILNTHTTTHHPNDFKNDLVDYLEQKKYLSDSNESESDKAFNHYNLSPKKKDESVSSHVYLSDQSVQQVEKVQQSFSELMTTVLREMLNTQTKEETLFMQEKINEMIRQSIASEDLFQLIKRVLMFEKKYYVLIQEKHTIKEVRKTLVDRFTRESQKKNFKKAVKSSAFLNQIDMQCKPMIFKSKYKSEELLKKRKNKTAESVAQAQMKGVYCLSILCGYSQFLNLLGRVCDTFFDVSSSSYVILIIIKNQLFHILYEVQFNMQIARKVWKKQMKGLPELDEYEKKVSVYGLWATLREKQYQYSFPFVKSLMQHNPHDEYLISLLSLVFRKINNPMVYKTWLAKISPKVQENKQMVQIIANQSYSNTYYEAAIDLYKFLLQQNENTTLNHLLIALSFLQMASSRSAVNKESLIKESLYHFDCYRHQRQSTPESHTEEVIYNMGRMYAHLNLTGRAMDLFQEVVEQDPCNPKIKFKAALNLMQLYLINGEKVRAAEIMDKYLTY